jgi:carbonic anhydrase/acetyltransferase-like protein (isoleucine patch superfamily)
VANRCRELLGFMDLAATAALREQGVILPDIHSTLVSPGVVLEPGVVLWPGVAIQRGAGGEVRIGANSVLFPGTRILAQDGRVDIGRDVEIGEEGGFTIKAECADIMIGKLARLLGGGSMTGGTVIGDGAQVLGPIRMQRCTLGTGGSYREADPDRRGGVLKGSGVARGITVPQGHVIQAFGLFDEAPIRRQSYFHPPAPAPGAGG